MNLIILLHPRNIEITATTMLARCAAPLPWPQPCAVSTAIIHGLMSMNIYESGAGWTLEGDDSEVHGHPLASTSTGPGTVQTSHDSPPNTCVHVCHTCRPTRIELVHFTVRSLPYPRGLALARPGQIRLLQRNDDPNLVHKTNNRSAP